MVSFVNEGEASHENRNPKVDAAVWEWHQKEDMQFLWFSHLISKYRGTWEDRKNCLSTPGRIPLGLFPRRGRGDHFTRFTKSNVLVARRKELIRLHLLCRRYLKFQFHRQEILPFYTHYAILMRVFCQSSCKVLNIFWVFLSGAFSEKHLKL